MSQIVEVRPVKREKWHGIDTGKNSIASTKVIEALVNVSTNKYQTGLTPEDQERLEELTGYDLSAKYIPKQKHPFWSEPIGKVKLNDHTNVFDISVPLDEIRIKLLKASPLVANSQAEVDGDSIFVIYDEHEEVQIKATKAAIRRNAIIATNSLSTDKKAEIVQIALGISVRNQSNDFIDLKLEEAIETKGAEYVLSLTKRDKAFNTMHSLVLEALHKNILRKEGPSVYYMDDQIGYDVESAVTYLLDKKNQILKGQILEKLN